MSMAELREVWDRMSSSGVLLGGMLLVAVIAGILYQLGVITAVIRVATKVVVSAIRGGFGVWRRLLAWVPWPILLVLVLAANIAAPFLGSAIELATGSALLFVGVCSCMAYVHLDTERAAVERGYKAMHNPLKGQMLAADLARYGERAGTPLLIVATIAIIFGFTLLNNGLYQSIGKDWYTFTAAPRNRAPGTPVEEGATAGYFDFLAYTLINFVRVVDLLDIANAYNYTRTSYVQQTKWPSSTLLMLFRSFFTMVLLQQVLAAVRRGNLLHQCIQDFWSPHGPIHDRAAMALQQQGIVAVRPLLRSLRTIAYLTPEQREELPKLLAEIGPGAVPILIRYLRDRDENIRIVAVGALGRLQALEALKRLSRLAGDSSDAVRLALAETLVAITTPGAQFLAKQWRLRNPSHAVRTWLARLRDLVPWWQPAHPVDQIVSTLRRLIRDDSTAVRGRAVQALANLGPSAATAAPELQVLLNDADESVRCQAILTLSRITVDEEGMIEALPPLLADGSPHVRAAAARAAGTRGEAASPLVPALLPLLRDTDPEVRGAAAAAIAEIGTLTDEARRELTAGLSSQDNVVRAQTAEVMGTIKFDDPTTLPALIQALEDDNDQVRNNAAEAIGNAGEVAAPAVSALIAALRDSDNRVGARAAWALGQIGPAAANAGDALAEALGNINPEVRARAAEALGAINGRSETTSQALRQAAQDTDGSVRAAAIRAIASSFEPQEARELLLQALDDGDPRVRTAAVESLADQAAVPEVTAALVRGAADTSDEVKQRVAIELGEARIANEEVLQALCTQLTDDTPAVQITAVQALGKIGKAAASTCEVLARLLLTGDVGLRRQVLRSLALIDPLALMPVARTALNDDDIEVRKLTAAALLKASHLTEEVVHAVIESLRDPDVQVRSNAAQMLGRLERIPEDAVAPLIENLANPDDGLRLSAARALARISGEEVDEAIVPLLSDTNPNVRLTAARRLLQTDPNHTRARAALAADLHAEAPHVREAALEVVRELGLDRQSDGDAPTEVVFQGRS